MILMTSSQKRPGQHGSRDRRLPRAVVPIGMVGILVSPTGTNTAAGPLLATIRALRPRRITVRVRSAKERLSLAGE